MERRTNSTESSNTNSCRANRWRLSSSRARASTHRENCRSIPKAGRAPRRDPGRPGGPGAPRGHGQPAFARRRDRRAAGSSESLDFVHLLVLWLEGGEPTDRDMPGGGEDMGAMTRMLLVVAAKLAVGGPGRLLGDEAGSEATKRVREGDGRLEDTESEVAWAHHSLPIPLDHPIGITFGLGEQAIASNEPWNRVSIIGGLRCTPGDGRSWSPLHGGMAWPDRHTGRVTGVQVRLPQRENRPSRTEDRTWSYSMRLPRRSRADHLRLRPCIGPSGHNRHPLRLWVPLGGTRFSICDRTRRPRRRAPLAKGMTYKAAGRVDLGGGKAVIIGDPATDKTEPPSGLREDRRFAAQAVHHRRGCGDHHGRRRHHPPWTRWASAALRRRRGR